MEYKSEQFKELINQNETVLLGIQAIPYSNKDVYIWFIVDMNKLQPEVSHISRMAYLKLSYSKLQVWRMFKHILKDKNIYYKNLRDIHEWDNYWTTKENREYKFILINELNPTINNGTKPVEFLRKIGIHLPAHIDDKLKFYEDLDTNKALRILFTAAYTAEYLANTNRGIAIGYKFYSNTAGKLLYENICIKTSSLMKHTLVPAFEISPKSALSNLKLKLMKYKNILSLLLVLTIASH